MRISGYIAVALFAAMVIAAGQATAQGPDSISYQGLVLDAAGDVVDGDHTVTVSISHDRCRRHGDLD